MIRRDRHVVLVLLAMLCLNVFTAFSSVFCVFVYRRRFRALSVSLLASSQASEKASVEAAATAMLVAEQFGSLSSGSSDEGFVAPPRLLGYGQTHSRNAVWIYRDIEQGGVVHREFVQRIPFSNLNSAKFDLPDSQD